MQRSRLVVVVAAALFARVAHADAARPRVLVVPLKPLAVEPETVRVVDTMLVAELSRADTIEVMSADEIQQLADLEAQKQAVGCDQASCLGELAGAMGARYAVFGNLGRLGSSVVLALNLWDAQSARPLLRDTVTVGSVDQLPGALGPVVHKLVDKIPHDVVATPPPAAIAPGRDGRDPSARDGTVTTTPVAPPATTTTAPTTTPTPATTTPVTTTTTDTTTPVTTTPVTTTPVTTTPVTTTTPATTTSVPTTTASATTTAPATTAPMTTIPTTTTPATTTPPATSSDAPWSPAMWTLVGGGAGTVGSTAVALLCESAISSPGGDGNAKGTALVVGRAGLVGASLGLVVTAAAGAFVLVENLESP